MCSKKNKSKNVTADGYAYLTKRIVVSRAKMAGKSAAETAMNLMGFVVVAEGEWIVRKYKDGRLEQIAPI